jgi:hypothetical protein
MVGTDARRSHPSNPRAACFEAVNADQFACVEYRLNRRLHTAARLLNQRLDLAAE